MDKREEHFYEAELYRLKGELTLPADRQGQGTGTEGAFLKANEGVSQQQAKSLELRATMSLARLWQQQGTTKEAHQLLSEIYSWFTEGFDIKDLQEAKVLLDALA